MAPRKPARRARRSAPKAGRRRRPANSVSNLIKDNHATCSATQIYDIATQTVGSFAHSLVQYDRAVALSTVYQEFRIDYVEFRFRPRSDTYQEGGFTAPQLYYQILKDGSENASYTEFLQNGINPRPLSKDGLITWKYKPAVVLAGTGAGNTILRTSPWMNTDNQTGAGTVPNGTEHFGTCMYIDSTPQGSYICGTVEIEAHFSFRKPRFEDVTGAKPAHYRNGVKISDAQPAL